MNILKAIEDWYQDQLSIVSGQSNVGLARSFLALGSLLTITFNTPELLFVNTAGPTLNIKNSTISLFYLLGPEYMSISIIICIIILVAVISGFIPRITCILHWWVSYSMFNSMQVVDGGDQITNVLTLLELLQW